MSKTEMLRQSAQDTNERRLEALAQQVQAVRQAKSQSVEELAATLEPLAQALAALSEDAGQTLSEIDRQTRASSADFKRQLDNATRSLNDATALANQTVASLNRAANRLEWRHYALTALTGMASAMLVSVFWLWLEPPTVQNQLDAKAVAEYLKPDVIAALKPSKGR